MKENKATCMFLHRKDGCKTEQIKSFDEKVATWAMSYNTELLKCDVLN